MDVFDELDSHWPFRLAAIFTHDYSRESNTVLPFEEVVKTTICSLRQIESGSPPQVSCPFLL